MTAITLRLLEKAGKLQVGDALHIILDIARALEHAHKSLIIHRDIKPSNILLTSSGLAKLSDLGLAKRRDDPTSITHADQGIGERTRIERGVDRVVAHRDTRLVDTLFCSPTPVRAYEQTPQRRPPATVDTEVGRRGRDFRSRF